MASTCAEVLIVSSCASRRGECSRGRHFRPHSTEVPRQGASSFFSPPSFAPHERCHVNFLFRSTEALQVLGRNTWQPENRLETMRNFTPSRCSQISNSSPDLSKNSTAVISRSIAPKGVYRKTTVRNSLTPSPVNRPSTLMRSTCSSRIEVMHIMQL
jgi:hypothetical protein